MLWYNIGLRSRAPVDPCLSYMKLPLPIMWSIPLRRLLPALVLALWLAPQLLLAGHGHWDLGNAAPDCEICLQLAASTPALDAASSRAAMVAAQQPVAPVGCFVPPPQDGAVACRGPPVFPRVSV